MKAVVVVFMLYACNLGDWDIFMRIFTITSGQGTLDYSACGFFMGRKILWSFPSPPIFYIKPDNIQGQPFFIITVRHTLQHYILSRTHPLGKAKLERGTGLQTTTEAKEVGRS